MEAPTEHNHTHEDIETYNGTYFQPVATLPSRTTYRLAIIAPHSAPEDNCKSETMTRRLPGDAWTMPDMETGWTDNGSPSWYGSDAAASGDDAWRRLQAAAVSSTAAETENDAEATCGRCPMHRVAKGAYLQRNGWLRKEDG